MAWSIGASSNTMFAALPPSSSVMRLSVPTIICASCLPTSVEPVNAILFTSGCLTMAVPVSPAPVTTLTTPSGNSASWKICASRSSGEAGGFGRLDDDGVAAGKRRRDFPRGHQQRKIPRNNLAGDAQRPRRAARKGVFQLVGPARVIKKMRRDEGQIHVARFLDGLAAVHAFEHGQFAHLFLDDARDAVKIFAALASGHFAPDFFVSAPRGLDRRCPRPLRRRARFR